MYWLLLLASVFGLGFVYWFYGPLKMLAALGFFILGFSLHKHRAYIRSLKDRALADFESALGRWFGA